MRPLCLRAYLAEHVGGAGGADHAAIARASLTEVIRPGYAALAEQAGALEDKTETLCKQPSAAALEDRQERFRGER